MYFLLSTDAYVDKIQFHIHIQPSVDNRIQIQISLYKFEYIYLSMHIKMNEDRNIHMDLVEYEYRIFWMF
jgi:hypothetical protein